LQLWKILTDESKKQDSNWWKQWNDGIMKRLRVVRIILRTNCQNKTF
jgi:hypothetical protein